MSSITAHPTTDRPDDDHYAADASDGCRYPGGKTHSHNRAAGPPAMTTVSDRVIATETAPAAELTDGYHVVVEALKLNGVETIYGCGRYPGH